MFFNNITTITLQFQTSSSHVSIYITARTVMTCRAEEMLRAGRNPQSPTTASCGLLNTNANIIILQLSAKYAIRTFWKNTLSFVASLRMIFELYLKIFCSSILSVM